MPEVMNSRSREELDAASVGRQSSLSLLACDISSRVMRVSSTPTSCSRAQIGSRQRAPWQRQSTPLVGVQIVRCRAASGDVQTAHDEHRIGVPLLGSHRHPMKRRFIRLRNSDARRIQRAKIELRQRIAGLSGAVIAAGPCLIERSVLGLRYACRKAKPKARRSRIFCTRSH